MIYWTILLLIYMTVNIIYVKKMSGTSTLDNMKLFTRIFKCQFSVLFRADWMGENTNLCLGLPKWRLQSTAAAHAQIFALEKIKMISCSPRHALILSSIGNIYSVREPEGIGLGDAAPRPSLNWSWYQIPLTR